MQGVAPFSYQGADVLSWLPDGIQGRGGAWETPLEHLDVPSGAFAATAPALHPVHTTKAVYRCATRAQHAALSAWLDTRLGRFVPFWCPTFQRDLEILDPSALGTWIVRSVGYSAMYAADPATTYLYGVRDAASNAVAVKVTSAVDNGDGTETITYSTSALLVAGSGGLVVYEQTLVHAEAACLLRFARLDDDAIRHTFHTREVVDVAIAIASILNEQP